jgi:hypothetical protein
MLELLGSQKKYHIHTFSKLWNQNVNSLYLRLEVLPLVNELSIGHGAQIPGLSNGSHWLCKDLKSQILLLKNQRYRDVPTSSISF